MEEKTKKLLEFLEPYGLVEYRNISGKLNEMYPWTDLKSQDTQEEARKVKDFLRGLTDASLIKMRDRASDDLGNGNMSEGYRWFNTRPIDAVITATGLDKLYEERQKGTKEEGQEFERMVQLSTIRLNSAIEGNIPRQNRIQRTTMWAIILTGLIALIGLIREVRKPHILPVSITPKTDTILISPQSGIENLNKNLQQIDSTLKTLKDDSIKTDTKTATPKH